MNPNTRTTTILIVDDDPAIVRLLEAVLKREFGEQLNIETLIEAIDACQRIDRGGIDILLTDLEMPAMSGLQLLRKAKGRNAFIQVLFLTGHSTQEAILDALEHGATDYILKPIDQRLLIELVREAMSRVARWRAALGETWKQRRERRTAEEISTSPATM